MVDVNGVLAPVQQRMEHSAAGAPISQWRGRLIDNAPSCDTPEEATTTVPARNGLIYMLLSTSCYKQGQCPHQRLRHCIHYPRLIQGPPTQLSDEARQLETASSTTAASHEAHSLALLVREATSQAFNDLISNVPASRSFDDDDACHRHSSTYSDYSTVGWRRACVKRQHQRPASGGVLAMNGLVHCIPPANAVSLLVIDPVC
ncbi:hypothetical protein PTSG_02682 [Salpingoeca rosetta]|uniref:Uncharacterized protein n=1 Tax=Salpingoeca rosetta (strain ATCC 50818 / BSB-021) TaxID=946362 RepID=F2U301_SALR5|nr:uncharacterized protein PTSG_02682 [Salpingoeca rosetta]EGD81995.1 hypothetical protein PTSG_02682 [Salpingoeca rosetta]|eukprot:XP_004996178.1 hypothetical protein PTSG_02682 [Salpingoeca rosetta]